MGKVIAANFRVGRTVTAFLPEESGEATHNFERQSRVRQLIAFVKAGEPAIISRPESYGLDDLV
jgi:hypothetical protein